MDLYSYCHNPLYYLQQAKDRPLSQGSDKETIDDSDQEKTLPYQHYCIPEMNRLQGNKKLKNQLCKNFIRNGVCNYGFKCQFAHGIDQLRKNQNTNSKYKTKQCSSFFNEGVCMYGMRCNFLHHRKERGEKKVKVPLDVLLGNYPQLVLVQRPRLKLFQAFDKQY